MNQDETPEATRAAPSGWKAARFRVVVPANIRLCMGDSTLFTAEMACRYGGNLIDTRSDLERLARLGVLVRRTQARGVEFYHRKI